MSVETAGDNDTCLELALEGEKLCKAGKYTGQIKETSHVEGVNISITLR